jgi:hypothetical protein
VELHNEEHYNYYSSSIIAMIKPARTRLSRACKRVSEIIRRKGKVGPVLN